MTTPYTIKEMCDPSFRFEDHFLLVGLNGKVQEPGGPPPPPMMYTWGPFMKDGVEIKGGYPYYGVQGGFFMSLMPAKIGKGVRVEMDGGRPKGTINIQSDDISQYHEQFERKVSAWLYNTGAFKKLLPKSKVSSETSAYESGVKEIFQPGQPKADNPDESWPASLSFVNVSLKKGTKGQVELGDDTEFINMGQEKYNWMVAKGKAEEVLLQFTKIKGNRGKVSLDRLVRKVTMNQKVLEEVKSRIPVATQDATPATPTPTPTSTTTPSAATSDKADPKRKAPSSSAFTGKTDVPPAKKKKMV